MGWKPQIPTEPVEYRQPPAASGVRDPWRIADDDSELGLPRSRDAQSTRVAGDYAAKAPSTNPDRRGGRVRRRPGEVLRQ